MRHRISIRGSVCPSNHPSVCPPICPSILLFVCPSVHPPIRPSVRPSISLSVHPFIHLSVCLFVRYAYSKITQMTRRVAHLGLFLCASSILAILKKSQTVGQSVGCLVCLSRYHLTTQNRSLYTFSVNSHAFPLLFSFIHSFIHSFIFFLLLYFQLH